MSFEFANKIDNLHKKTEMIRSLQGALCVSIFHQDVFAITDFEWAFSLLENVTAELEEALKKLTDEAYEGIRKGGE